METHNSAPEPRDRDARPSWDRDEVGWDNHAYWFLSTGDEEHEQARDDVPFNTGLSADEEADTRRPVDRAVGDDSAPWQEWPSERNRGITFDGEYEEQAPFEGEPSDESVAGQESSTGTGTNWKALVQEIAETLVLTLLIFFVMKALVQNYRIEGYSMEPNLHEGQRLFVSKVAYYFDEPQRGDIIVFEYPKGDPNGPEKDYIKRIIGVPGDTVECRPNEIYVNGEQIEESYNPNPHSYLCAPITLGPDEYFVLGDNRNHSSDSHVWGPLERKYIIGKAWFMYYPLQDIGFVPDYKIEAPEPPPLVQAR